MLKETFNRVCPAALHPTALARNKLRRVARGRVLAGPFAGMRYAERSVGSSYEPKLLGTYEMELHPVIERLCARQFPLIVNAGAGEGYYSVGMAARCPEARVVAFESDGAGRALIREMARVNGVDARVQVRGLCEAEALAETAAAGPPPCLLIVDVEGAELSLLHPGILPVLERSHILVELHDFIHPGLSAELESRFRPTHRIEKIRQRGRRLEDLPFRSPVLDRWLIRYTDEQRPTTMEWFYMWPRREAAS